MKKFKSPVLKRLKIMNKIKDTLDKKKVEQSKIDLNNLAEELAKRNETFGKESQKE